MLIEFRNTNGQTVQVPHKQIMFVLKKPLDPVILVALNGGTVLPCYLGETFDTWDKLQKSMTQAFEFQEFVTTEGGTVLIHMSYVLFYTSPSLGVYGIICQGKAGIEVKATADELSSHFQPRLFKDLE